MRRKASPRAPRCGTAKWRCESVAPCEAHGDPYIRGGNCVRRRLSSDIQTERSRRMDPGSRRCAMAGAIRESWLYASCFHHKPNPIFRACRIAASRIWRVQLPGLSCKDACRTLRSPSICSEIKRFPMVNRMQFYIDGAWVDPAVKKSTPRRQSGDRGGDVRDCARLQGRRRQGGRRRQARLRDLSRRPPARSASRCSPGSSTSTRRA